LRLAFVALGAVLLTPLGFLLDAVDERIEAQRRLRHDVVAERIFDELERELTTVLESESARPSAAYGEPTRIEAWAPFVVGYFKLGLGLAANSPVLLAREQLDTARTRRLSDVLAEFARAKGGTLGQIVTPVPERVAQERPARSVKAKSSVDVLQKLNRSQEERSRKSARPKEQGAKSLDPMQVQ
jgi:hypothetical protein